MKSICCKACYTHNAEENLFCSQCGTKIDNASAKGSNIKATMHGRRQVSVLFANIIQSDRLIHHLDPEHYDYIVHRYHSISEQLIGDYGGQIIEKLGDGVMALFSSNELATESAVRAGIELVDNINQSRVFRSSSESLKLQTRIGIASGEAIIKDSIGNHQHKILGEPTFLASRLQALAKASQVLVCNDTYLKTEKFFRYSKQAVAPKELKGFENIKDVWQAQATKLSRLDYVSSNRINLTPFTGRKTSIETLLMRWELTLKKQGQVTLIKASAGMGKSRILAELYRRLKRRSPKLIALRYHCSSFASKLPLYPAMHQITRATQIRKHDSVETVNNKLHSLIGSWGIDADLIGPILSPLLFHSNRHKTSHTPEPHQISTAIRVCTAIPFTYTERAPVLVFVEDMHWADAASIQVLLNSVAKSATANIMFVVTYRDDDFELPELDHEHVHQMSLKPLSDQSALQLLDSLQADHSLSASLKHEIIDKSAGVPLFLEELALHSDRSSNGNSSTLQTPASLFDLFIHQYDQFSPAIKSFAQTAAIFGLEFDANIVSNSLNMNTRECQQIIAYLSKQEQIYMSHNGAPWYQFKHALIRNAIYDNTLNQDKHNLHKKLYQQLTKNNDDDESFISQKLMAHHQKMFQFYATYANV